jgi:lysophospholipase L1-like esterase
MSINGVILFGDSIFAGMGATERDFGCAKIIKSNLSIPVSLKARNWNTSADGLKRLDNDVIAQAELSHVLILFGNNDCWITKEGKAKVSIEEFRQNLACIVERIKVNNQVPIICNLQPIDSERLFKVRPDLLDYRSKLKYDPSHWQAQYSQMVESVATELNSDWINIRATLKIQLDLVVAADGLHPTDQGHKIIADMILQYLKKIDSKTCHLDVGQ